MIVAVPFCAELPGGSINNRSILNCSHFLTRRYFSKPFSPKWSIHTGKLSQQTRVNSWHHMLFWFGVTLFHLTNMGGSANSVLWPRPSFLGNRWGKRSLNFVQVRLARKETLSIAISKPGALLGLGALLDRQFQSSPFFVRCHGRRPAGRASLQKHSFLSKYLHPSGHEVLG